MNFVVGENMVAAFDGKTVHRVLSTFHLVYYSEYAARKLIEPYFEDGEDAAGAEICLRHLSPSRVGDSIEISASLLSIAGRKIVCEIKGTNAGRIICEGTQTQFLIDRRELDGN